MPRFLCPICTSINWRQVVVGRRDGSRYITEFYECCTCSAMFRNPDLFTVARGQQDPKLDDERQSSG